MMSRVNVVAVSYLNTIPFIYGVEHADLMRANLLLSPPAICAERFARKEADIALIPVAEIFNQKDAEIITPYCIGASSPVRTVVIMSNTPIESAQTIYLDAHSRTSAMLTKLLARDLWKITPRWSDLTDYSVVERAEAGEAFLLIGDKVFDYEGRFEYVYDLAECWNHHTGLPFVFAAWIARKGAVSKETIEALEGSLRYGLDHIPEAISYYGHSGKSYAEEYLTKNIDFTLDLKKREALSLFRDRTRPYVRRSIPD